MFNDTYKEGFIYCNTKQGESGTWVLDIPFRITSRHVFYNGRNFDISVPQESCEVMAHVTYFAEDEELVKAFAGYMGDNSTAEGRFAIFAHPKYATHWKETLATSRGSWSGNLMNPVFVPYDGPDKDKLSPCCVFMEDNYEDK